MSTYHSKPKAHPTERVDRGIAWFDSGIQRGNTPSNWRSRIRLADVRFANIYASLPVQVFGSYEEARRSRGFEFVDGFYNFGCLAYAVPDDVKALRDVWNNRLRTEEVWKNINNKVYVRTIKGCKVKLNQTEEKTWVIYLTKSGETTMMDAVYKSVESAKRAVRKLAKTI